MISQELQLRLSKEGYIGIKEIDGEICAMFPFIFTWGLVVGLDWFGYKYRFCYHTRMEAAEALYEYESLDYDPPGNWIKEKGRGDRPNPNYQQA